MAAVSTKASAPARDGFGTLLGATLALWALVAAPSAAGRHAGLLLVLAPLLEETLFRAGLQEELLRRWGARHATAAGGCTALAFAAAHLAVRPCALAALTFLPALAIGVVYARTRRLAPCIALHAAANAVWLLACSASTPPLA
jgi:hypothetical protein